MNTTLTYLYRDASNYKQYGAVTFTGEITDSERDQIRRGAGGPDGASFLPDQVGLPTLYDGWDSQYPDDHVWHEVRDLTVSRTRADDGRSITEFAAEFAAAAWDAGVAETTLAAWKSATRPGR